MQYSINDIYPCVQGEGSMQGVSMILIRFQGCGVGCAFCDTKETWDLDKNFEVEDIQLALVNKWYWLKMSTAEILDFCDSINPNKKIKWLMFSGGEPADYQLSDIASKAKARGYKTQIETSGTALGHLKQSSMAYVRVVDHICCSPKYKMKKPILEPAIKTAHELKFVVGSEKDIIEIKELLTRYKINTEQVRISLQPLSASKLATKIAYKHAIENGWHLSLQTHKWILEK
jgi:7-carboxy-7-deazaguanine synthase